MDKVKKITKMKLFLPVFSMLLVMMINVIYDIASGNPPFGFFSISINNGILYGRLIDILNRGSEVAILAIGMTLVVSASAGTDISVGSVISSEIEEMLRTCNRMAVLRDGAKVGEISGDDLTQEGVMKAIAGGGK